MQDPRSDHQQETQEGDEAAHIVAPSTHGANSCAPKPIASLLEQKAHEGAAVYNVIKAVLLASMSGYAPQVAVEFGRKNLPSDARPTFLELEEDLKSRKGK